MTIHVHTLGGCTPDPLAHYLKALAILRLVAEQRDKETRAFWAGGTFKLVTTVDREALVDFLANTYVPTPILAPWNGGSGFYPKDNRDGINTIRESTSQRFHGYREAIRRAEEIVGGRTRSPKDDDKSALLAACARLQQDEAYAWLSAAVAIDRDGNGRYPALLGTGGNDGRLDFTNNFMQRLTELIDVKVGSVRPEALGLLDLALFGGARDGLVDRAIGQLLPGGAGGANGTAGFEAAARMNPWDFVLMLEGAVVLRVASLRRLDGSDLAQAAAPFALRSTTEGYGSAAPGDAANKRGEQWLPVWSKAATYAEIKLLFGEAKLASGRAAAASALDAVRAVARLGAARGVTSFRRFSFIERNGQANLAVALGEIPVIECQSVRLLDELDGWLSAFRAASRRDHVPESLERDLRSIEGAAFACADASANAGSWQRLVMALGQAEQGMVERPKATHAAHLRPLPLLSPRWLELIDDGSSETRVAMAIASGCAPAGGNSDLCPIRMHAVPLAPPLRKAFSTTSEGLAHDPDVVWTGRSLVDDLAACALRRATGAKKAGYGVFPLDGFVTAPLIDVAAFLEGRLDESRVALLARGLMAVDFQKAPRGPMEWAPVPGVLAPFAVFRCIYQPFNFAGAAANDPTALRQLWSGRLDEAFRTASRRLVAMGLRPKLRVAVGDELSSRRIAAALAIPISRFDFERIRSLVTRPFTDSKETST
jgi:CRISPR-associated protein Csx17